MSEKRFTLDDEENGLCRCILVDGEEIPTCEICDLLNEQQDTILTLKRRLEKINGGYGHLTHRNGLTANEWVIESQERELKKKNEQISDWIEQHSKDIVKIGEQQITIRELKEEMVRLHKMSIELMDRVIPNLRRENGQLQQIIKDIVVATDETYTKNTSIFKVTILLDYDKYMEIRRCIE